MEIEGIYLFDNKKELIDVIQPSQLTENSQDWTLNSLIKGSVTGVYTESIEQAQYYGTRDIDEPNVFWVYKIINYTKQNNLFNLDGIYTLFDDLSGRGVIRDRRPKDAPITTVLGYILEDTGWQIGQVYSTHKGTSNYYYVSKLEAFWDFFSKWRVEFKPRMTFSNGKITGKYIDIYDRLSDDFGKWYEYGDTLLTVEAEEMRENVFTAFVGRGKGEEVGDGFGRKIDFKAVNWTVASGKPVDKPEGQDYVEVKEATALYGYEDGTPRMTIVDFPDIEDSEELITSTYEYALAECRPKVQFKANVSENGRADVGETVTIIRNDIGIRYKTRIFNNKRNFLNKNIKTIQFGEQLVQSTSQTIKKTATAIKKQEEQTLNWLLALRQAITDSYFNEDGYNYELSAGNEYGLPGGYYSFNRPIDQDPSKVVYVGAGKVLLANTQNPDGSWIWRTAMNGDGITLDAVNTGILTAGVIQSPIDGSYWDLENGVLDLKSGVIRGLNMEHNLNAGTSTYTNPTSGDKTILKDGLIEFEKDNANHYWKANREGIDLIPNKNNVGNDLNTGIWLKSDTYNYIDLGIGNDFGYGVRVAKRENWFEVLNKNKGDFRLVHGPTPSDNRKWSFQDGVNGSFIFGKTKLLLNGYDDLEYPRLSILNANSNDYAFISAASFDISSERELKSDIVPLEGALGILSRIPVYQYTKSGQKEIGIIADEAPEQLLTDNGTKVSLYSYISTLHQSIKELSETVAQQELKIEKLTHLLTEKGVI